VTRAVHTGAERRVHPVVKEPKDMDALVAESILAVYIHVTVHRNKFLFNNQPGALIIQIYSVIKFYMFRASSLPIIRIFLL
jgi:hypothetical protein